MCPAYPEQIFVIGFERPEAVVDEPIMEYEIDNAV